MGSDVRTVAGFPLLPLKTQKPGPAPIQNDAGQEDIVDEAIKAFRWNIFFKEFEMKGGSDKLMAYLIVLISKCLAMAVQASGHKEAQKQLEALVNGDKFAGPGDATFCLSMYCQKGGEQDAKAYFKQLRQETVARMLPRMYYPDGNPNKWWFQFAKKKFMNLKLD